MQPWLAKRFLMSPPCSVGGSENLLHKEERNLTAQAVDPSKPPTPYKWPVPLARPSPIPFKRTNGFKDEQGSEASGPCLHAVKSHAPRSFSGHAKRCFCLLVFVTTLWISGAATSFCDNPSPNDRARRSNSGTQLTTF